MMRLAVVAALLAAHVGLALSAAARKCATADEPIHLAAGTSYWRTGDFRLDPENGLLPQAWAAIPLVAGRAAFPTLDQRAWWTADGFRIGYQMLYEVGNDPAALLARGRAMIALLSAALGLVVYTWSRSLFGEAGGLLSLALYAFHPSLLAHGALATSDLAAALFFTTSLAALGRLTADVSARGVALGAASIAALFLSKASGLLIVPIALVIAAARIVGVGGALPRVAGRAVSSRTGAAVAYSGAAVALAVLVGGIIWACYGFRFAAFVDPVPGRDRFLHGWEEPLAMAGGAGPTLRFALAGHWLPESFLHGVTLVLATARSRPEFWNGHWSADGWWFFFPYCFLVKTPLPLLMVVALAATAAIRSGHQAPPAARRSRREAAFPLCVLLVIYWGAAVTSHLNIGERHLLPTYPAMVILAGAAARWLELGPSVRPLYALAVAGAALHAVDTALVHPSYLAYFNALAGGPRNGYRHLVDSSLDWGQDLPALAEWLEREQAAHGDQAVYLSYFGMGDPRAEGIRARRLPSFPDFRERRDVEPLFGGIYCISATMLQSVLLVAQGPWRPSYEREYERVRGDVVRFLRADPEQRARLTEARGQAYWDDLFGRFDDLRLARLCAFLREREPDDEAGHSILIYRLSDADVARYVFGPPPSLEAS